MVLAVSRCLRLLLNNKPISDIMNELLTEVIRETSNTYGLIGERKVKTTGDIYYRYYGIYGVDKDSMQYKRFKKDGYFDDRQHNMHIDLVEGHAVFYNDLLRRRGRKYPEGHPNINKVIFIPLKNKSGNVIGVLVLGGDTNFSEQFVEDYSHIISLTGLFLQLSLERYHLQNSKNSFLANISHEIRTPLSGIICMTKMLSDETLTDRQRQLMNVVDTCCVQLMNITNDILDYTNITSGKLRLKSEPIVITKLLDTLHGLISDKIQPEVQLKINMTPDVPPIIIGDRTRIIQVLLNLIDNSAKYTKNGTIELFVECDGITDDKYILHFRLTDTGTGIPEDRMDSIFDTINMYSTDYLTSQGGIGLGLPIVKNIVELYKGTISVYSKYREGTTIDFTMSFDTPNQAIDLNQHFQNMYILVYDSDDAERLILFDVLLGLGARPVVAYDRNNLIHYLNGKVIDFKLIICRVDDLDNDDLIQLSSYNIDIIALSNELLEVDIPNLINMNPPITSDNLTSKLTVICLRDFKFNAMSSDNITCSTIPHVLGRMPNILIADDDLRNQEVLKIMLNKQGYEKITMVNDGLELYSELMKESVSYDIAFVDLKMPLLDGISAIKKLNDYILVNPDSIQAKRRNKMLIIAVTASVSSETRKRCFEIGMNGYITKPISDSDLEKISTMLRAVITSMN